MLKNRCFANYLRNALSTGLLLFLCQFISKGQEVIQPTSENGRVSLISGDEALLESQESRSDLPCTLERVKPELGFDLRFHAGYVAKIDLSALVADRNDLKMIFRVVPSGQGHNGVYFVSRIAIPALEDGAKGVVALPGSFDVGEGSYHVDWFMRDRGERVCSSHWDISVSLPAKDRQLPLLIAAGQVTAPEPEGLRHLPEARSTDRDGLLRVSVVANVGAVSYASGPQQSDLRALNAILRTIARDPRIGSISLTTVDIIGQQVLNRQDGLGQIDLLGLQEAPRSSDSLTVNIKNMGQKHKEGNFLSNLLVEEMKRSKPNMLILVSPKLAIESTLPREVLQQVDNTECQVFYMSVAIDPNLYPWRDMIAGAVKMLKGIVYPISQPRDFIHAWADLSARMEKYTVNRIEPKTN